MTLPAIDHTWRTRLVFGAGCFERLGELSREQAFRHTLIVADAGMVGVGLVERAERLLGAAGIASGRFHGFDGNPDEAMVEAGARHARTLGVDSIVGLGGGSSLDSAKAIACILANGGRMRDYWGYGKSKGRIPPLIGVPTTAGSGSDAQSYCLITRQEDRRKMACGDPGLAFRLAVLDPDLVALAPRAVRAAAGYDALSHAVESAATTAATTLSRMLSREAFRLLMPHYPAILDTRPPAQSCGAMLLGSHLAGAAIESSMLGAAHACANPLTSRFGVAHGIAVSLTLPHVVRANAAATRAIYEDLLLAARMRSDGDPAMLLANVLEQLALLGGLPRRLREVGVAERAIPRLSAEAAEQWTARFNPRPMDAAFAEELYRCAW